VLLLDSAGCLASALSVRGPCGLVCGENAGTFAGAGVVLLVYRIRAELMRPRARGFNRPGRELGTKKLPGPSGRPGRQRHGMVW
jgi:hypothetical protein